MMRRTLPQPTKTEKTTMMNLAKTLKHKMVTNKTNIWQDCNNESGEDCEENRDCDDEVGKHLQ
jgi:hypothetical protein